MEPVKRRGTVPCCNLLLRKYLAASELRRYCIYSECSRWIQSALMSTPSCSTWSAQICLTSSMKHLLTFVPVETKLMSMTARELIRQQKKRDACQPLANALACGRSLAFKETLVSCVRTMQLDRSQKCSMGLKIYSIEKDSNETEVLHRAVIRYKCG